MPLLRPCPGGQDRSWMRRHPPSCLGTNPSGETKEGPEANLMRPRGFPRDYRHLAGPHEAPSAAEVGLRYIRFKAPGPVSSSQLARSAAPMVSQMWAGGQAESSGAGVTLLDWLDVMVESDIVKAYRWYCRGERT
jgi:hypothetical protein